MITHRWSGLAGQSSCTWVSWSTLHIKSMSDQPPVSPCLCGYVSLEHQFVLGFHCSLDFQCSPSLLAVLPFPGLPGGLRLPWAPGVPPDLGGRLVLRDPAV